MFVGVSGVGKTELAKKLAKNIYPGSDSLIKLDMSEYSEGFGVSKLLGSPAGYVGYKESNHFTDKLKMNPYCVILFDEIDKAHPDVTRLLLQMLDNGEITDSAGRKISLKHAIIVLTTTVGAEQAHNAQIGFGSSQMNSSKKEKRLRESLKEYFSPELINRLNKICLFDKLSTNSLAKIAQLEIDQLNKRLKKYNTKINNETDVLKWLISQLPDKNNNARETRSFVRQQIETLIADIIVNKKIKNSYELKKLANKLKVQ